MCRIHLNTGQRRIFEWRNSIAASDPLVPLLQVLTFGILNANRNTIVLLPLISNMYALTNDAMVQYVTDNIAKGPLDNAELYGSAGTSWYSKMMEYRQQVSKLITELCADLVPLSAAGTLGIDQQLLIDFMVMSTAGHNQFGDSTVANIAVNLTLPPLVRTDDCDSLSYINVMNMSTLVVALSGRGPLLSQSAWYQHLTASQQLICTRFQSWMAERRFGWFQPANFEVSIAV